MNPFQVGGPFSTAALQQMNDFGRIAVCGSIATYNDKTPQLGSIFFINVNIHFIY